MTLPLPPPRPLVASVGDTPPQAATPAAPGLPGLEVPLMAAAGLGLLLGAIRVLAPNCRPDRILVIAGRGPRRRQGDAVGYRVVHGGRALVIPWLEQCRWMDVRCRPVPIRVEKAYALGGTPIDVEAVATIKISTNRDCVGNAIERFLGTRPRHRAGGGRPHPRRAPAGDGGRPHTRAG
ncbi:MAG: hypothetical protein ACKOZW_02740, partial [Cyanobium sp.]